MSDVVERLEEVKKAIHGCWLEAETAEDCEFFGTLEEELEQIIRELKKILR